MTIHNKQWHNFAASEARALGDIISESTGSIISECPGDFIGIRKILDVSGRPVSSHPHLATLKLVTVRADEIFLAVCFGCRPSQYRNMRQNILKR